MSAELYARVTATILAQLETAVPESWTPPWHGVSPLPVNATTDRRYRGINVLALWVTAQAQGYGDSRWATYRQWAALGAQVRKGERGTAIIFYKDLPADAGPSLAPDEACPRFVARASYVFNAAQVDGAPDHAGRLSSPAGADQDPTPDSILESFVTGTGATIVHGGSRACYNPATDTISLPHRAVFHTAAGYASTLTHELIHWTGAPHRLARDLTGRFGGRASAAEELVAEIGAAFVLADLGLARTPHPDHAT